MRSVYLFLLIALTTTLFSGCNRVEPFKNPTLPTDQRVDDLLSRMSLDQKLLLLQGTGMGTVGIDTFGIPALECSDGPFGAHRGSPITSFPCGNAIGATWDTTLIREMGTAIGKEANAKKIKCLLGPGINIIRHPLCGRNFEYYSEDPFLTGRLAVAFTKGLQGENVAATIKHYAVNNQEFYRNDVDVTVSERALQEIYLPGFKAAVVDGDAWSVMSAYNKVNGTHCSENKYLLTDMLKDQWGFRGFVMPDWAGAHSTAPSANAGLDCVVYDSDLFGKPLAEAVKRGEVAEATITEMARRVLRVIYLTGLMDENPYKSAVPLVGKEYQDLNRKIAREGMVLLKNDKKLLPLKGETIKNLAVIGPNAAKLRMGGGGSSYVGNVFYKVTPLEGITRAAESVMEVAYALGASIADTLIPVAKQYLKPSDTSKGTQGLWAEYYNNMDLKGTPVATQLDTAIDFVWQAGPSIYLSDYEKKDKSKEQAVNNSIGNDYFSIRWTGTITPPKTGYYDFVTHCDDGVRLYINDKAIIDQWFSHDKEFRYGTIKLEAGKSYKIKVEYYEEIGGATIRLGWYYHDPKLIDEAVALAKKSDAVVICAGIDRFWEAEGADRSNFELPLVQNELIQAVASVNSNVVVVLNNGGPLNVTPWINDVSGLLEAWFTGNEGGNAIADVLFGNYNPSGKLPYSYVQKESDFPPAFTNYLNRERKAIYTEGIYVGYRYHDKYQTKPLFPFGFGLSYTTFEYANLKVDKLNDEGIDVTLEVTNSGGYDGTEIVQVYVSEVNPTTDRSVKELKGFGKQFIEKGETQTIKIQLKIDDLGFFDEIKREWKLNKGKYNIQVGSSSVDIRQAAVIEL
jgi:beta-glucosidase